MHARTPKHTCACMQVSLEERTKFKQETYVNVDGRRRSRALEEAPTGGGGRASAAPQHRAQNMQHAPHAPRGLRGRMPLLRA